MLKMCLVSVIIPYFNSEGTILRALKSVKAQSFKDYEIILVDDGSRDGSHGIVEAFKGENLELKIINIYQENMGPSAARNNGIRHAKGEYIAFLDADDEWRYEKLDIQLTLMEEEDIDMLGCNYYLIKDNSKSKFCFVKEKLKRITFKELLYKHYFATPCVIVRKSVLLESGFFPEKQHYMEDSYVFTSIARKYRAFMCSDGLVNIYKLPYGEAGLSSKLWEMEKYELLNFRKFRKENNGYEEKLNFMQYLGVNFFSLLKYIKRSITVKIRIVN